MIYKINKGKKGQGDALTLNGNEILYFSLIHNKIIYKLAYYSELTRVKELNPETDELYINGEKKKINF